jgi:outer membrane receptor for ferrienterochelin and colicins
LKHFFFISLISVLAVTSVAAQDAVLTVLDAITKKPLPFVHVQLQSLDGTKEWLGATDPDGKFKPPFSQTSTITISCIGYQGYTDTLSLEKGKEIEITPAVLDMDAVVVTAQYSPRSVDQSIYPVRVISPVKMNSKASPNLRDLLSDELSMRISQDGALGANLSLRGLSGEHIKFLIDGVPVIGRMNGNIDLAQLNLNNISHVEIIEGPMSVVYGSNALAGVVNIITRDNFAGQYRAGAETYWESVGTYNASLMAASRHKNHSWSISAARNFFDGWSPEGNSRFKLWKPKRQYDTEVWHAYRKGDSKLRTTFSYFHELLKNKGALLPPYYETAFDNHFHTRRWTLKAEGHHPLSEQLLLEGTAAWSDFRREKETLFKDLTTLTEVRSANTEDQDTSVFSALMIRTMLTQPDKNKAFSFQAGTDIHHEFGEGKRITDKVQDIGDYAVFASLQIRPFARMEMQPGLRFSHNTRYNPPLVWSMHLKYAALEELNLRGSFSRGFRAPSLKELYLYFVDINHNIQGNPELKAEYSWNSALSASIKGRQGRLNWSAELHLFQNDIENIITLAQSSGTLYTYINVEDYHTRGAEIRTTLAWHPYLTLKPGVSLTGRTHTLEEAVSEKYRYSTDFNTSLSLHPGQTDWALSAFYKYTGSLPQFYLDLSGKLAEGYIEDYHTLDISVSRHLFDRTLQLSAGVKNAFDNTNIAITGGTSGVHGGAGGSLLAGYGRTWFFKLNYTISHIRQN